MGQKLLIVDDESHIRMLIEQTLEDLEDEGVELLFAENGAQALEIIQQEEPNLVFLDVMMPKKDGYEVCAELKKDDRFTDIAILMLTAVADHVTSTRYSHFDGMSMEADDYLPKPASAEEITESLKGLLNL